MPSAERSEVFCARVGSALPVSAVCRTQNKMERSNRRAGETLAVTDGLRGTDARSRVGCGVEWRGAAGKLRSQAHFPGGSLRD